MANFGTYIIGILKNKEVYGPIVAILVGLVVYKICKSIVARIINYEKSNDNGSYSYKKRRTVIDLISNIIRYIIFVVVIMAILEVYSINTTGILASLGVASAVLGLAFQDALKDFIGGISIILENYYMVGDYVKFGDFTGKVIELGLKCTKIKSLENGILIVANRNVTEVINYSQTKADIQIRIPVAYEENDAKVTKAIADTLKNIKNIKGCIPETVTSYGIVQLNNSSVDYLIGFLCNPEYQFKAKRDALKIIKETMDVSNVKIPYNQIEVHNGKNI